MLVEGFLRQAKARPGALALVQGDRVCAYGELAKRAKVAAVALRLNGVAPGDRVAVHIDRGVDAVTAVFGVLLAGACYVPLDLANPPARRAFIVRDAAVRCVIHAGEDLPGLPEVRRLDLTQCAAYGPDCGATTAPEQPAAMLYTSGSTGQPKGVVLSHAAIAAFADWAGALLDIGPADRLASSAPLFFDLSTLDLFAGLARGASLHFVPASLFLTPARLTAWLAEQAISGWYTVPSLLGFLAYKGALAERALPAMRFLGFAGEVFPTPGLARLAAALPQTRLFNFYGPTETNVCCYWEVERSRLVPDQPIPIGRPAAGAELRIAAESGELWVRGPTLLSGYWQGGQAVPALDADGWYATGDRVSRNAHGEFMFLGRLGRTLKCSGYRVEPAEIETALHAVAGVLDCAVVGLADPVAGQRPAAALALAPQTALADVQRGLRAVLPAYMWPARLKVLAVLPRLATGKIDYARVQALLESPA